MTERATPVQVRLRRWGVAAVFGTRMAMAECGVSTRVRLRGWRVAGALVAACGVAFGACASTPRTSAADAETAIALRIRMDRELQLLPASAPGGLQREQLAGAPGDLQRAQLARAAALLGDWTIHLAGEPIDGPRLERLAATPPKEPLLRAVREDLRRAVDLEGFVLWLDDVLVAGGEGLRGSIVWVSPGRGRKAGVLVHPDAIFGAGPRRYGASRGWLDVSPPKAQTDHPPALDGEPLGPRWTMRYRNPDTEAAMLGALAEARPQSGFAARLSHLIGQLRAAGAEVQVNSTLRHRERGYLMWGAFALAHVDSDDDVAPLADLLDDRNRAWGLDVPVLWLDPGGTTATRAAAREMAETYDVVYATEEGAKSSSHYGGRAVDFTAVGLPRVLVLETPSGERRRFDLSDADETRDLSLTPRLIEWVESGWGLEKLRADYPHWNDATRDVEGAVRKGR